MTAATPAVDTSPAVLYIGRDVWVRLRLPGAPSTHHRAARIGSIASASRRFAAALSQPPAHRVRVRGPEPVRPTSLRGASTSPPRWWHPGLVPSAERADWVRALRPSTAAQPVSATMPARGLPRAARSVPDEKTWTPGGIVGGLVTQVAAVRRHTEVAAVGPMLTSHDRAKLAATDAARPRAVRTPPAPPARPASPSSRVHDPPKLGQHRSASLPPTPSTPTWQPARPSRMGARTPTAATRRAARPPRGAAPTDPADWIEMVPGGARTSSKAPNRNFFSVAMGFDRFTSRTRSRESQLNRGSQPTTELRPATSVATAPAAPVAIPVAEPRAVWKPGVVRKPGAVWKPGVVRKPGAVEPAAVKPAAVKPAEMLDPVQLVPGRLRTATAPKRDFFSVALGLNRFESVTRRRESALNRVTGRGDALDPALPLATAPSRPAAVPVRPASGPEAPVAPVIGGHRLAATTRVSSVARPGITIAAHRARPSAPPRPAPADADSDAPKDTEVAPVRTPPTRSSRITLAATRSLATSRGVDEPIRAAAAITPVVVGPRLLIGAQRLGSGTAVAAADPVGRRRSNGFSSPRLTVATPSEGATVRPITSAPGALTRLSGSIAEVGGWVGRLGRDLSASAQSRRAATATEITVAARSAKETTARSINRLARAFGATTDIRPSTVTPTAAAPSAPVRVPDSALTYAPGTEPDAPPLLAATRPRRNADAASFRYIPAPPPMAVSRPSSARLATRSQGKTAAVPYGSSLFGRLVEGPGGVLRRSLLDLTADLFAKDDRHQTNDAQSTGAMMSPDARDLARAGRTAVAPPERSALNDARLMQELVDRVVERIEDKVVDELERRGRRYNPGVF